MRKNGYSLALAEYEVSLRRARRLQQLEASSYEDPAPPHDLIVVEGLRAGATVLMVATFERYLRDAFEEFVDVISKRAQQTSHAGLASDFVEHNDLNYFSWIIRYSRLSKTQRVAELKRVAKLVAADGFVPEAFSRTRANPGPTTVKDLFREFGIANCFAVIEINFQRHFKKPFPVGFVEQTLEAIVSKRNEVAHGGVALSIGRRDLKDWIDFFVALGRSADNTLRDHTLALLGTL